MIQRMLYRKTWAAIYLRSQYLYSSTEEGTDQSRFVDRPVDLFETRHPFLIDSERTPLAKRTVHGYLMSPSWQEATREWTRKVQRGRALRGGRSTCKLGGGERQGAPQLSRESTPDQVPPPPLPAAHSLRVSEDARSTAR